MFELVEKELRSRLRWARVGKYILLVIVIAMSLSISFLGLYVIQFAEESLDKVLVQTRIYADLSKALGHVPDSFNSPEKVANMVGQSTMWIPVVGGVSIALCAVVYLFRICTKLVSGYENKLVVIMMYRELINREKLDHDIKTSFLSFLASCYNDSSSQISVIPTVELAEKSIDRISSIVAKGSTLPSRLNTRRNG
jgi:hypothetical protein